MAMQRTITMPLFAPLVACTLAAVGLVALSRMLAREWRRVNAQLDAAAAAAAKHYPTLRLDPETGEYRLR